MHRRYLIMSCCIVLGSSRARGQDNFSEVVGTLGRERTLAEAGASIMKRYAPEDIDGQLLYAQAKAAFDQLIDQLLADLDQAKNPDISTNFHQKVQRAVDCRMAFSERVTVVIKDRVPSGAKALLPADLLAALGTSVGELVKQLVSSGIDIWREWRSASSDRRNRLARRLEAQRWTPFADIPEG